ncbi:hypothetical protein C5167_036050 [Papaver somniferum]|nr:hypothetical protein C5167_036050 [Papaver somniferum]
MLNSLQGCAPNWHEDKVLLNIMTDFLTISLKYGPVSLKYCQDVGVLYLSKQRDSITTRSRSSGSFFTREFLEFLYGGNLVREEFEKPQRLAEKEKNPETDREKKKER